MLQHNMIPYVGGALISVMTWGMAHAQPSDPPLTPRWGTAEIAQGYVVFTHSTLENLSPTHVPAQEAIAGKVSCALAQDEYASMQIGIHALAGDLANIQMAVTTDLGVTVYRQIDPATKQQLASDPDGMVPRWMASEVYLQRGQTVGSLPKGRSVNFWLTFRAEPQTSPGMHAGRIRITVDGRPATELDLLVQVRPFQLAAPRAAFGMYYREDMLPPRLGAWGLADQLSLKIYRDMAAHGQNSVTFYGAGDFAQLPPRNSRMVEKYLALAGEAGLTRPDVPSVAMQANIASDYNPNGLSAARMKAAVEWLRAEERKQGWPEIMIYGWDEAPYPAPGLRETYAPLRKFPIRLCAAMDATGAYAYGDVHGVWIVMGGDVTPQMRAEAARLGAQVWTYSYRIWRAGFSPLRQRYYAGLYTWAHQLGGNYVWAYSHGHHSYVWWEPGRAEPLPVTAWEARREGVDDYRYLQMVEDLATAKTSDPTAIQAAAWIAALRARVAAIDPHRAAPGKPLASEEYEALRTTAADYIQKLGPLSTVRPKSQPITYLRDEAAAFRGQSVKQCMAGLEGSAVSRRRAAAWALFELGPQAAPATAAIGRALADAEVRFPALRALEAIGADASPAAPAAAALLSNPDDFVRLSATFALAGMAQSPTWNSAVYGYAPADVAPQARTLVPPLCQTLRDSNAAIALAASLGLFRCGQAAAPALADAIKLFENQERGLDAGNFRESGLRVLAGIGPAAASAVPQLIKAHAAAKGQDHLVAYTLAAIGPAASDAVAVLEKYRTPENSCLADTCYALFCIRGGEAELRTMAGLLGDKSCPGGVQQWQHAARSLIALGGKAAPVAALVRERLPLLESQPSLRCEIESSLFKRITENAASLRLLPR